MSRRNTRDPLARMFLDRYHLHLLAVPREGSAVGDVYVADGPRVFAPGNVEHLLEPAPAIPAVRTGERLADVAGLISDSVEAEAGVGLLGRFLAALGAGDLVKSVKAKLSAHRVKALRFRLADATRDSVDPLELGASLIRCRLRKEHPFVEEGRSYFLVTAVARTRSLEIVAEGDVGAAEELKADVASLAEASASVKVTATSQGAVTFQGDRPLAFGVELFELVSRREQLKLKLPDGLVQAAAAGRDPELALPAALDGPDGDLFLRLE